MEQPKKNRRGGSKKGTKHKYAPRKYVNNSGWIDGRTVSNLRLIGLPKELYRDPVGCYEKGMALVEELKVIEEQLTKWEDAMPLEYLEKLPWWEERKKYREQKAQGNVPVVEWYEALSFLEESRPSSFARLHSWGLDKKKAPKKEP
jgi:hypothetical protein